MPNTANRNYPYPAAGTRPAAQQLQDLAAAIDADLSAYEGAMFSARNFGAVGDGAIDESAVIQSVIDAAASYAATNGTQATVIIEPGRYLIGADVDLVIKANVTVLAHGCYFLKDVNATAGFFRNFVSTDSFPGYTAPGHFRIFGGIWDGNALNASAKYDLFNFCHSSDIIVKDAVFRNVISYHALEFNSTDTAWAINCRFEGFYDIDGTRSYSEAIQIDCAVAGSSSLGPQDGTHSKNITVFGCTMEDALDGSLGAFGKITGSHTTASGKVYDNIKVVANYANNGIDDGIQAYNWANSIISHNVIYQAALTCIQATGPDPATVGFSWTPKNLVITGNSTLISGNSLPTIGVYGFSGTCGYTDVVISRNCSNSAATNGVYAQNVNRPILAHNNVSVSGSNGLNCSGSNNPLMIGNISEQPATNYCFFFGQITTSQGAFSTTDGLMVHNVGNQTSTSVANIRFSTGVDKSLAWGNVLRKGSGTVNAMTQGSGVGTTNVVSQNDSSGFGDLTTTYTASSGTLTKTIAATTNIGTSLP